MAGKDDLSNAVLGGASDYMLDIGKKMIQMFFAQGEEKVFDLIHHDQYVIMQSQAKLTTEFKEKTVPDMFGVIQKHIKDGHFIGSDGVCMANTPC